MVVVGARGRGGFARLRLGSVGRRVASEASSPVVIVHPCAHPDGAVVVGVDGLPSAREALLFAADEARTRGVDLRVVMAWSYQPPDGTEGLDPRRAEYTVDEAHRALRQIVDEVLGACPGLEVSLEAPFDLAAKALIERSAEAALVVVGPRNRSLRHRIDLGSVTAQLLRHAECPVAVVRGR